MSAFKKFYEQHKHAHRPKRLRAAIKLMEIEDNPLTDAEIEMIQSFRERGLSSEERKAEIVASIERDFGVRPVS